MKQELDVALDARKRLMTRRLSSPELLQCNFENRVERGSAGLLDPVLFCQYGW